MPHNHPVKVCWFIDGRKPRSRGFDMLVSAQRFASRLSAEGFSPEIYVQGALFENEEDAPSSTYDPRYEIPF